MSTQHISASALPRLHQETDFSKLESGAGGRIRENDECNTIMSDGGVAATGEKGGRRGRGGGGDEQEMYHLAEENGNGDTSGKEEEGGIHWAPASLRASLETYRWAEILVLVVIVTLTYMGFNHKGRKSQMFIPQVTQLLPEGTSVVLGNATAFSYPIKFQDGLLECVPTILQNCGLDAELAAVEPCCAFMETGAGPHQTISSRMLVGLCMILPLILLLLRHAVMQKCIYSSSSSSSASASASRNSSSNSCSSSREISLFSSPSTFPSATQSLRDVLLGFFFSMALTVATTNSLKNYVSHPRPNHFALLLFASLSSSSAKAAHYAKSAWESWPSGHCSISMTAGAYISLVFLRDIKQFAGTTQRELRTILVLLALGPVFLALFIAGTRVHDYFHSAADAATGMGLGLLWALVAFFQIIPANGVEVRPNKPLKYL